LATKVGIGATQGLRPMTVLKVLIISATFNSSPASGITRPA
jgi:hypothetical protein